MTMQFYNTLTRATEPFKPLDPSSRNVKLYTCGPTVYNHAHIGNFRCYVFEDLLQRHLEARGFRVERVMNLTDVDDKTIRGSREAGVALEAYTRPYKEAFFEDLATLRIKPADRFPAATDAENIERMIAMISSLMERGHAYQAEDGSVYFRLSSFPEYGKLAHLNLEELRPSGRIRNDEYEKESIGDFALWKAWDAGDGDVAWESPWGRGRPGWHIECSAMAGRLLGDRIDIHCGGVDNIFPHHEAEIAQTECFTGQPFVNYWLHNAHLLVDGRKMSKSEGNFFTLRDLLAKGWSGREIRYVLIAAHYRLPLNFTFDSLAGARSALQRLDAWAQRLRETASEHPSGALPESASYAAFFEALDDDLNISAALAALFDVVRETNRGMDAGTLAPGVARAVLDWWEHVDSILQFHREAGTLPDEIRRWLEERAAARAARDWSRSDQLRDRIQEAGWIVKDTKDGQKVSPSS